MKHCNELMRAHDRRIASLMARQVVNEQDPYYGGFWTEEFHVEPRESGFFLSEMIWGYVTPFSQWYLNGELAETMKRVLIYMRRHQRPDGCFDLTPCNYASPPDTAFMVNAMLNGWWLMEKSGIDGLDFLREPMYELMNRAADGIAGGGFHTPNHRWAIASCLLSLEKITGRGELGERARVYLNEGLDINEDGEFAERSAGNYNQVNDDQMIRLFLATGDQKFLEAAARNLEMMYCYFDPDGSVFTNNSTRQDMGRKVYADSYYVLYLMVGYLLKRKDLAAMAGWIWQDCRKRGIYPEGIEWLLLMPEMDGWGEEDSFNPPIVQYERMFPASNILRVRRGEWSLSLMKGKGNFLYFQHGSFSMYMTIYANICNQRNFLADTLEKTERGYRMTSHAASWYYLPFKEKPETSDWWAMDNVNRREKTETLPLDMTAEIVLQPDGVDIHISTSGLDRVPFRAEFSFLAGGYVRTEHFIQHAVPGGIINVLSGEAEACGPRGEAITVGPAFGAHDVMQRMNGAYPFSESHYTVCFTDYTPVDRVIRIRAAKAVRRV